MEDNIHQRGNIIRSDLRVMHPPIRVALVIPVAVWDRLIQRINTLKPGFRPWAVAYSVLFGIGVTAGLSIVPLTISDAPPWAVPTYAATCASALIIGIAFVFVDKSLTKHQVSHISQLAGEMEQIRDESFDEEPSPQPSVASSSASN